MKNLERMIAVLMALTLCVCAAGAENAEPRLYFDTTAYVTLADQYSGRAELVMSEHENGAGMGVISWGDSADVMYQWTFTPAAGWSSEGVLTYTDCVCSRITLMEEGPEQVEVLYENGTGSLTMTEGGITWQDDQENAGENCLFMTDNAIAHYVTNYVDTVSQRAMMQTDRMFVTGSIDVRADEMMFCISWADSAFENNTWTMTIRGEQLAYIDSLDLEALEGDVQPITYTDCVRKHVVYAEDGSVTEEIVYENGTGAFVLCNAEGLDGQKTIGCIWKPDHENLSENCLFVPNMIEGPANR